MLGTATITYDLADMLGVDFDARRTKVWVTTNVPSETVVDTDANKIRLGSGNGTISEDGTGSVTVWTPDTGANPASWQTYIHVAYPDRNTPRGRAQRTFGPFTITASADLADLVEQQEMPPEYIVTVTSALSPLVSSAQAAATTAAASATSAAASASTAQTIVLGDTDLALATVVADPTSDTTAALTTKIAADTYTKAVADTRFASKTVLPGPSLYRGARLPVTMLAGSAFVPGGGSDATDPIIGTANYQTTTNGAAGGANWIRLSAMTFPTMTGKGILLNLKVTNGQNLAFLSVDLGNDGMSNYFRTQLPVPSSGRAQFTEGQWTPIFIPFSAFAVSSGTPTDSTITAIRVLPIDISGGNTARVDIASKIGVYTEPGTTGTLAVSCDDSYKEGLTAIKKLAEYGWRGTLFPIVSRLDSGPTYMTTADLIRCHDLYGAEIGTHCMTDAQHVSLVGQTTEQIQDMLLDLRQWQQSIGVTSPAFAYPIGPYDVNVMAAVAPYFEYARTNDGRHSPTRLAQPLAASAVALSSTAFTLAQIKVLMDKAVANRSHLHLIVHRLPTTASAQNEFALADFNAAIDYAASIGMTNILPSQILSL